MGFLAFTDSLDVTQDQSTIINPLQTTIVMVRRLDTSVNDSTAFMSAVATAPDVCGASLPWGDGNVYWSFGGNTDGVNMATATAPSIPLGEPQSWVFVAGPHGMAIYQNGVLLASHATAAAGPSYTGPFHINASAVAGPIQTVSFFAVLDAEWNAQQAQEWTGNQSLMFARRNLFMFGQAAIVPGPVFTIDGVEKQIQPGWRISENLNERNTMTFSVLSLDGSYRPEARQVVNFRYDGTLIFAGHIHHTDEKGLGGYGVVPIETACGATDYNALTDRRQAEVTLAAGTLKSQKEDLDAYLTPYGVISDPEQVDGPAMDELTFQRGSLTEGYNKLSVASGYAKQIDYLKVSRMYAPGTTPAPFNIADNDGQIIGDVTVSPSTDQYANRIIVLAGSGTQEVEDHFTGDGVEDTFELNYNVASLYGYVVNNAVSETLRISGDPDSATWEYDPDTRSITRLTGAPGNGNAIVISYVAQFPFEATAEDVGEQDGGANLIERVYVHTEIMDITTAQALADGYLVKALITPREVRYTTLLPGVHPGMSQYIECTPRNLDGYCLITNVDITANGNVLRYEVRATEGLVIAESHQEKWRLMTRRAA